MAKAEVRKGKKENNDGCCRTTGIVLFRVVGDDDTIRVILNEKNFKILFYNNLVCGCVHMC